MLNRLYLGEFFTLYDGVLPDMPPHQHTTGAICVSLDSRFTITSTQTGEKFTTSCAFIPQDYNTTIEFFSQPVIMLCLEVESRFYEQLLKTYGYPLDQVMPDLVFEKALQAALQDLRSENQYHRGNTHPLFEALMPQADKVPQTDNTETDVDQRIRQVINQIKQELALNHDIDQLAQSSSLSASRLTHLFREQTGLPIRRYRLWLRIRQVVKLFKQGVSLTDAAIASGFSDSPHFSNSCKRLLGIAPSDILKSNPTLALFVD